jgi:molecular chaperone IbpA|tara:strand:- start:144 stop:575 length:432 start_codon:yes stop_codon:yes gene_type:complete
MGNLVRYRSSDLPELMDKIMKNSIGINDDYLDRFFNVTTQTNYPPYNLVNVSNEISRLEIALAGFKKKEVKVYTEYGKLYVTGSKEEKEDTEYVHKGLAQRSFERAWTLSDDTEVRDVSFADGLLTVTLGKIVPEHHARKEYL